MRKIAKDCVNIAGHCVKKKRAAEATLSNPTAGLFMNPACRFSPYEVIPTHQIF